MTQLTVSLACQNSDRTRPLLDGRVRIEGVTFHWVPVDPEEIFHRAFRNQEFDVCEISLATHLTLTSRAGSPFTGVPAFLSRAFRHSAIYVRRDRGIATPADLKARRIGVPDYQQTAGLWVRGMMLDDYGVEPASMRWLVGGLEQPGRSPRTQLSMPAHISITPIANGQTLSTMLLAGEIDAIIAPRAPSCLTSHPALIARLFSDFRTSEEDYFRRHGLFPLMHCVGIRNDLAARHPWLAASLLKAFSDAKEICLRDMQQVNFLRATLPWLSDDLARVKQVMGEDFWPYGMSENTAELEAMARYAVADGLAPRLVAPAELFSPATMAMFKI
jgi:4,5-dihydroxyphthalate decarboxylase